MKRYVAMCAGSVVFGARDETVYRTVVAVGRFTSSIALLVPVLHTFLDHAVGSDLAVRSQVLQEND